MSSNKYRNSIFPFLFFAFTSTILLAGTTGKISGRVIDKESGAPLPSANVAMENVFFEASTEADGYYAILQVPAGTHSMTVSLIGYSPVTVKEIPVRIDQNTVIDIEMVSAAIEPERETIVAKRDIVQRSAHNNVSAVQPEEIQHLSITSLNDIVELQAGVDHDLKIRGGETDQLLFQIDGFTMRDSRNNKPITTTPLSSIRTISIERGGFNAEYGQVLSGLVNVVGREGDASHYFGLITVRYSPPAPKNFGLSVFDPNSMWNRPFLDDAVCWTGTDNGAWDRYTQRQYPRFEGWIAASDRLMSDNDSTNNFSPGALQQLWRWEHRRRPDTDAPDYSIDGGFGGPVPFINEEFGNLRFFTSYRLEREMFLIPLTRDDYKEYVWNIKMNSDVNDALQLILYASAGKFYTSAIDENPESLTSSLTFWDPTAYFRSPLSIARQVTDQEEGRIFSDSWYSQAEVNHSIIGGKVTATITPLTFYEVIVERSARNYLTGPIRLRDKTKKYEVLPGYFVDEAPFGWDPVSSFSEISRMRFGGRTAPTRDASAVSSYRVKTDFTSQIMEEHLVKTGIEFSYYDLAMDYAYVLSAYGISEEVNDTWNPYRLSIYAQDEIEAFGFIANLGIRMDINNANTEWTNVDPFSPYYMTDQPRTNYPTKKNEMDVDFSPRVGIAFPITEHSKLYFCYGQFKEMPPSETIFRISRGATGSIANFGDPNFGQIKTTSLEFGYNQSLFDSFLFQVLFFYNEITNQLTLSHYLSDLYAISYIGLNNGGYAFKRGVEVTVTKSYGDWVRGFFNYTYLSTTTGTHSKAVFFDNPVQQRLSDQYYSNLSYHPDPQPHVKGSVTFLTPKDFGLELFGIHPLNEWSLNISGEWKDGEWINYNPNAAVEFFNTPNVQVKDYYNIDLKLNKTIDFSLVRLTAFIEIHNLLNVKRLSGAGFYDELDGWGYYQSLHLPESPAYPNIPGDDRIGEYNRAGYFQPIEWINDISTVSPSQAYAGTYYYEKSSGKYFEQSTGSWKEVDQNRMREVLDKKAYIDMPNNTSFNFLNPRQIFFGMSVSFNL